MLENLRKDIEATRVRGRCSVGKFLDSLDEGDRCILESLLADTAMTSAELAFGIRGYVADSPSLRISSQTVGHHRRRGQANGCTCP